MAPRKSLSILALALVLGLLSQVPQLQAAPAAGRFAVASENPLVTRVAMNQLRAGASAVDAAVAAVFMAGVANPVSSGLGGGGFALYWEAATGRAHLLDFREVAPRGLDPKAFAARPMPDALRGQAVGVPGELLGLWQLHQRFGKKDWAQLVEPAQRAAKDGFELSPHMQRAVGSMDAGLRASVEAADWFTPGRKVTRMKNAALAHTLDWVAQLGPYALYDGPIAGDIIATVAKAGGALSYQDLRSYRTVEREPLHVQWEGYDIYTMGTPSGGGVMLAQVLGMFSKAELQKLGIDSGAYAHQLAEAMRSSFADRFLHIGDPAFEPGSEKALLDPQHLQERKGQIDARKTKTLPQWMMSEHGTHHLVVADAQGNVVSLTTTVNNAFGAKLLTRSGLLLNDELNDFARDTDFAEAGLKNSPNRARALARPVSSMAPTVVVKDGKFVLALGGSGGFRIGPNVTQALLSRLVFGNSPRWVAQRPRFAVSLWGQATLKVEAQLGSALFRDLQARGETVETLAGDTSGVQLVAAENGRYLAGADPRKSGLALTE